jgi:Lrp/AsnC family transcriptional regulator
LKLSRADRSLLNELQQDATRNQAELAEIAGMSRTSCWRRMRDFEEAGLVERQVALLNPKMAGFNIQVVLTVSMVRHTDENRASFESHIARLPEVTECYSVAGDRDYLLHVLVRDMEQYNDFLNAEILKHPAVQSAGSTFVLRRIKYSTALPLEY